MTLAPIFTPLGHPTRYSSQILRFAGAKAVNLAVLTISEDKIGDWSPLIIFYGIIWLSRYFNSNGINKGRFSV